MAVEAPFRVAKRQTPHIPVGDPYSVIEGYLDFIKNAVKPYAGRAIRAGMELDDLIQVGAEAFMRSIPDYDPTKGELTTFMMGRMRGSIVDEFRSRGGLIHVGRSVLNRIREVKKAEEGLLQQLKREPTMKEVSAETGFSRRQIVEAYEVRDSIVTPTETTTTNGNGNGRTVDLIEIGVAKDNEVGDLHIGLRKQAVNEALGKLTDRERYVIEQYYYKNKPLHRIGEKLGVTESRACQIHIKALAKLGRILGEDFEGVS